VSFSIPATTGGAAPVNVTCTPGSGTNFPAGATAVSCTAVDSVGQRVTCGFGVTVTVVPRLTKTRLMAFGDSLTEGKLSLTLTLLVDSPAHSYPAQLLRLLTERYPDQQIAILNEGFGGERADASFGRFHRALSTHQPEAVLLMHGVNDLNSQQDGRIQSAVNAIEELVNVAKAGGLTTFVATLPPLGPGGKASCPECVEPFNERLRNMVSARGAVLVDVHAAWGNDLGLMGADGIHPTDAGYGVIANAFFEAIRRALETVGSPE
jgi:acyl-CoA thioesterase-1